MSYFLYQEPTISNELSEKLRASIPAKTMDELSREFNRMYEQMLPRQFGKPMMYHQLQQQVCLKEAIREILNIEHDYTPYRQHLKPLMPQYWNGADVRSGLPWYPQMSPVNRIMDLGSDVFVRRLMPSDAIPAHDTVRVDELWRKHIYSQMGVSPEMLKREFENNWPVPKERSKELQRLSPEREDADDVHPRERKYRNRGMLNCPPA